MFATAFPVTIKSLAGLVYSIVFFITSFFSNPAAVKDGSMPTTADDFTPAIRFLVCTDSHNDNENVGKMIDKGYELYDNCEGYQGIDLIVHAGDFTGIGTESEMIRFKETLDAHVKGKTQTLVVLGNHDIKQDGDRELFTEIFGVEPEQHIVVNGFHFIGVSSWRKEFEHLTSPEAIVYAQIELAKALEDENNTLPIFTVQHPHNRGTVYGSAIWSTCTLDPIWSTSSRVVNFSGHSHFPMSDPKSICQTKYTSLGVGAINRFELEKDLVIGQHPDGYEDAGEFYVVEADINGAVRIQCYDLITDNFFGEEYFIEDVNEPESFRYTYVNRMIYDDAPVFDDNAKAELTKTDDGYTLTFDRASDILAVHDYKVTITAGGVLPVYEETFISDYYLHDVPERMTVNVDANLVKGVSYTVSVTAVNAYYELSEPLTFSYKE